MFDVSKPNTTISLGRKSTPEMSSLEVDISAWGVSASDGCVELFYRRPTENEFIKELGTALIQDAGTLLWELPAEIFEIAGSGEIKVVLGEREARARFMVMPESWFSTSMDYPEPPKNTPPTFLSSGVADEPAGVDMVVPYPGLTIRRSPSNRAKAVGTCRPGVHRCVESLAGDDGIVYWGLLGKHASGRDGWVALTRVTFIE